MSTPFIIARLCLGLATAALAVAWHETDPANCQYHIDRWLRTLAWLDAGSAAAFLAWSTRLLVAGPSSRSARKAVALDVVLLALASLVLAYTYSDWPRDVIHDACPGSWGTR